MKKSNPIDDRLKFALDVNPDTLIVDDCGCEVDLAVSSPKNTECPKSGAVSKLVPITAVMTAVKLDRQSDIRETDHYYFCNDSDCPVIYFSNGNVPVFEKSDLVVKVFSKDSGMDVNVCYCYDWSRGRIIEQIDQTGRTTAYDEISTALSDGSCECEFKNPKGVCCLGDVQRFIAEHSL